jgi:hypothetical protein
MCEACADNYILPNDFTSYDLGYKTGWKDAELIANPINTNGHTYGRYLSIKNLYEEAILSIDEWSRGYAQGFDDWCVKNRH